MSVRTEAVAGLIGSGSVPVVASIAPDVNGVVHNVNADTAAAALAVALKAERLVVLTDVAGLYRDWPNSREVITELSASRTARLDARPWSPAWCPKMEACLRAVEGGLTRATVADGRVPHALLAGDLHQRRYRDHGDPGWTDPAGQPGVLPRPGHSGTRSMPTVTTVRRQSSLRKESAHDRRSDAP